MSRDIEKLVRKYRVENEYYLAEAMATGIVAAWRGIESIASKARTWVTPRVAGKGKRELASG